MSLQHKKQTHRQWEQDEIVNKYKKKPQQCRVCIRKAKAKD